MNIQNDKLLHFSGGVILFAAIHFLLPPIYALLLVVAIGAIKELWDNFHPKNHSVEVADFTATALGGLVGFICSM